MRARQHISHPPLVGEDFERVERELHERFVEAEREVLGELLESLDVDVASVGLGERRLHRVLKSTESYTTAVGPVKVARTLYRSARERAVAPMELRAGIVEGHWTPLAARQASCVVAQMTPSEGEALLRELGNMAPSKSSLDRLPKGLSARWEASREAFESTLREAATVPDEAVTVAVSLDGVMVPMKDGKRAEKRERSRAAGRRAKGPAGYQEAGCATLSFYDVEGDRLDTLSIARMPKPKKATLKTMLGAELDTVLRRRPDLQVVTVADGAHDNWRYLDALAPEATAVVDFYHAAEQLKSALDARYGRERCERARPVPQAASPPARRPRRGREGDSSAGLSAQEVPPQNAHRRGAAILPAQPPSHALRRHPSPSSAHRLRRRGGRLQDAGHATTEALRNAMAPPRRTGHLDAPRADTKFTLRPSVGDALRDLSSRGHRPRQRGGVSLQTCRMTNQCQSYTHSIRLLGGEGLPRLHDTTQREPRQCLDQRVYMVGHDDPRQQAIALAVEMQQRVLDHSGYALVAQPARTMPLVGVAFDSLAQICAARIVGTFLAGELQLSVPGCYDVGGDRVGQAEGNELDGAGHVEMGEVAAAVPSPLRGGGGLGHVARFVASRAFGPMRANDDLIICRRQIDARAPRGALTRSISTATRNSGQTAQMLRSHETPGLRPVAGE